MKYAQWDKITLANFQPQHTDNASITFHTIPIRVEVSTFGWNNTFLPISMTMVLEIIIHDKELHLMAIYLAEARESRG